MRATSVVAPVATARSTASAGSTAFIRRPRRAPAVFAPASRAVFTSSAVNGLAPALPQLLVTNVRTAAMSSSVRPETGVITPLYSLPFTVSAPVLPCRIRSTSSLRSDDGRAS